MTDAQWCVGALIIVVLLCLLIRLANQHANRPREPVQQVIYRACPFCSSSRVSETACVSRSGSLAYQVECRCSASVQGRTREEAKAYWNDRAQVAESDLTVGVAVEAVGVMAGWVATKTCFGVTDFDARFTDKRATMLSQQFFVWEPVFYGVRALPDTPTVQHKSTEITMAKTIHHEQSSFRTWRSDIPEAICIALNFLDMPILGLLQGTTPLARKTMAIIGHDRILTKNPRHPVENV